MKHVLKQKKNTTGCTPYKTSSMIRYEAPTLKRSFTLWTHKHQISQPLLSRLRVSQQWQYAKTIVKAARYPVNSMQGLWELLTKHHKEELPDLINLSQIALTLPLHTASCERVFSQQRLILTKQRSRIAPATSDKLLRTRLASNAGVILNFEDSPTLALAKKEANKNKIGKVREYTIK